MFSNSTNQVVSSVSINDYSTVSMELYLAALQKIQEVATKYEDIERHIIDQGQELTKLRQEVLTLNSQ